MIHCYVGLHRNTCSEIMDMGLTLATLGSHDWYRKSGIDKGTRLIMKKVKKRKKHKIKPKPEALELERGEISCHFLDSGSFSLWTNDAKTYASEHSCSRWDYYDSSEFWQRIDEYAEFVKEHIAGIDYYANMDVIPNAELSHRNLEYLETEHGLNPVPVVHYTSDLSWLKRYIDEGYELIALGGLVGSLTKPACFKWLDRAFTIICDTKDHCPATKIHGFGVTSYKAMLRYPWYSVDSTTWTKVGGFGGILVPHKRDGSFVFSEAPHLIKIAEESPDRKSSDFHFYNLKPKQRRIIAEWLGEIGIPVGAMDDEGNILEEGAITHHLFRRKANLLFFELMRENMPEYPWPWKPPSQRRSLGLV